MRMCSNAVNVYLPKDRVTNAHQGFGFVEFRGEDDADYVSSMHACWVGGWECPPPLAGPHGGRSRLMHGEITAATPLMNEA